MLTGKIVDRLDKLEARHDALDKVDRDHDVRIAKTELAVQQFEKGQARIEADMKSLGDKLDNHFNHLAESIREIRTVSRKD